MPRKKSYKRIVTGVPDGDDLKINKKIQGTKRIRLSNVRAQELKQKGGKKAKRILKKMVKGKRVTIKPVGRSYGRIVAKVKKGKKSVNKSMRKKGYRDKGR